MNPPALHPSPLPDDLVALLARTSLQDRAAFQALYDRTAAKLFGVVLRIVRDRAMAEDVLQEVYLQVWRGAGRYTVDSGRPMTWLISLARYRSIDLVRAGARNLRRAEPLDESHHAIAEAGDPETTLVDQDRLGLCLQQLDATHADCVLRAYRDGFSRDELAAHFGKPVNTIKTWLHRGLASLRICLAAP